MCLPHEYYVRGTHSSGGATYHTEIGEATHVPRLPTAQTGVRRNHQLTESSILSKPRCNNCHQNGAFPLVHCFTQSPRMPVASKSPRSVVAKGSAR